MHRTGFEPLAGTGAAARAGGCRISEEMVVRSLPIAHVLLLGSFWIFMLGDALLARMREKLSLSL